MITTTQRLTLDEYLAYDDGSDRRCELVNGELRPMSLGTGKHGAIIKRLERIFDVEAERVQNPWTALAGVVGLQSPRSDRWDTVRIPDVSVLTLEQWEALQEREAVIRLNEPPLLLVVEVVSESTKSTDYRAKRAEYSVLDIPEYWIVDSLVGKVTIHILLEGWYEATEYQGQSLVQSSIFPELTLTVESILQG